MNLVFSVSILFLLSNIVKSEPLNSTAALVNVSFSGQVGFFLEEIPDSLQLATKLYLIDSVKVSDEQWRKRAEMQTKYTMMNQNWRPYYSRDGRMQLTLPPPEVWQITFTSPPFPITIESYSYVARNYTFWGMLIGTSASLAESEPSLAQMGGAHVDTFVVPPDPEHAFQRVGYACSNEATLSLDVVNSENYWIMYDQHCKVEPFVPYANRTYEQNQRQCHWTVFPNRTCLEALRETVGSVRLVIQWKRVEWNDTLADRFRFGKQTSPSTDIVGHVENLKENLNIGYKYFANDSCALSEGGAGSGNNGAGCIDEPGWRHLFRFASSTINLGKKGFHLGDVTNEQYFDKGIFEWNDCHKHFHFAHYQSFIFGLKPGSKTGFCLFSSNRYYNNEDVPFSSPYYNCSYQGISEGWGDDYYQGLDCQWIDVTRINAGKYTLNIISNPDNFLCEGEFDMHQNGSHKWHATEFFTTDNKTVYKQSCHFQPGHHENNLNTLLVDFRGRTQTLVTEPCTRLPALSTKKDCGFSLYLDMLKCVPSANGTAEYKFISTEKTPIVVRFCESSIKLGHSTYCEYVHSLANVVVMPMSIESIKFQCPVYRDDVEVGGVFSILISSLMPQNFYE